MRDDFPLPVKETLAKRVAGRCSSPTCRKPTSGPQEDTSKAINIGVAAHITAASPDGPRYDPTITSEARTDASNGIWLCQSCAKLVDNDDQRYTADILRHWKTITESMALRALENRNGPEDEELLFLRLEQLMPDLLDQMRQDLAARPLSREFVLLKKIWTYWPGGNELFYYYEDHPDLENKLIILHNYGLIHVNTFNDIKRYIFTEAFVRYLGA